MNCQRGAGRCSEKGEVRMASKLNYCVLHARTYYAIKSAKRNGKEVPSFNWLADQFKKSKKCPYCGCDFKETRGTGSSSRKGVPSLQHYRDGRMGIVCQPCNSLEANSPIGEEVFKLNSNEKYCSSCRKVKSKDLFWGNSARRGRIDPYCILCNQKRTHERA